MATICIGGNFFLIPDRTKTKEKNLLEPLTWEQDCTAWVKPQDTGNTLHYATLIQFDLGGMGDCGLAL